MGSFLVADFVIRTLLRVVILFAVGVKDSCHGKWIHDLLSE